MGKFDKTHAFTGVSAWYESPFAIQVYIPAISNTIWIPKSQIDESSEVTKEGDEGILVVSQWVASKKGLMAKADEKSIEKTGKKAPIIPISLVKTHKVYQGLKEELTQGASPYITKKHAGTLLESLWDMMVKETWKYHNAG